MRILTAALPMMPCFRRRASATLRGFTLVEMLVVMLIIILLTSAGVPVIRGLLSSRNVGDGVDAINGYLAYARTQAMAQNTFVLVGFYEVNGSDDLQMGSVVSTNGTFNPAGFSPATVASPAANFPPLGKIVHLSNVTLTPEPNLSTLLQAKLQTAQAVPDGVTTVDCSASNQASFSNNPSYFSFAVGSISFSYCVVAFSPQGEALFFPQSAGAVTNFSSTFPFYSQLFIGLRATRGGSVVQSDQNSAAILLDGGSGEVKVFRL